MDGKSRSSTRKSAPLFDISTFYNYILENPSLRERFKCGPTLAVHPTTEAHKEQRLKFCRWLLDQPDPETFVLKVIWIDNFFLLDSNPPTGRIMVLGLLLVPMGLLNPTIEMMRRLWVFSSVNGKMPVVYAFMDENERGKLVNGDCFLPARKYLTHLLFICY